MSRGTRLLIATLAPTLVVLAIAIPTIVLLPGFTREVQHQQTLATVRQASLRLNALPGTDQAPRKGILTELSHATTDLADFVRPSVVHITGMQQIDGMPVPISTGSGWIYDDSGHVITNLHVVEGGDSFEVQLFDGELRTAEIVGGDPTTDIAVLSIRSGNIIPATRRPTTDRVRQGELCFAFGSPFDFRFSMSSGIVSGLGRFVGMFWRSGRSIGFENFIQVDAAINPGELRGAHSPIIHGSCDRHEHGDRHGRSRTCRRQQFAGIGLAIPIWTSSNPCSRAGRSKRWNHPKGIPRSPACSIRISRIARTVLASLSTTSVATGVLVVRISMPDHPGRLKAGLRDRRHHHQLRQRAHIGQLMATWKKLVTRRTSMTSRMLLKIWRNRHDAESS